MQGWDCGVLRGQLWGCCRARMGIWDVLGWEWGCRVLWGKDGALGYFGAEMGLWGAAGRGCGVSWAGMGLWGRPGKHQAVGCPGAGLGTWGVLRQG